MTLKTKLEFAVLMSCESCVTAIRDVLSSNKDIENVKIDLESQQVLMETTLTSSEVKNLIESSGRKAALVGIGGNMEVKRGAGSAVAEIKGQTVIGAIRIVQLLKEMCLIEGTVDGLAPGLHALNIHEYGDLSDGCDSCGDHFNPYNYRHGHPESKQKHVGDLGNIEADINGRATFRMFNKDLQVSQIIGRSMVIHEKQDDFNADTNGNSGKGIACAIIARSAGLFQNPKRLCTCDGTTIWQEKGS